MTTAIDKMMIAAIKHFDLPPDTTFLFANPKCVLPNLAEKMEKIVIEMQIVPVDEFWHGSLETGTVDVYKID